MSAPQSSSSDLAWVPAPRDIRPDEVALVRARVERAAVDETDVADLMGYLFGEVA